MTSDDLYPVRLPWSGRLLEGGMLARRVISLEVPDNSMMRTCELANTEDEMSTVRELMSFSEIR